jgi:hypothetical protein
MLAAAPRAEPENISFIRKLQCKQISKLYFLDIICCLSPSTAPRDALLSSSDS